MRLIGRMGLMAALWAACGVAPLALYADSTAGLGASGWQRTNFLFAASAQDALNRLGIPGGMTNSTAFVLSVIAGPTNGPAGGAILDTSNTFSYVQIVAMQASTGHVYSATVASNGPNGYPLVTYVPVITTNTFYNTNILVGTGGTGTGVDAGTNYNGSNFWSTVDGGYTNANGYGEGYDVDDDVWIAGIKPLSQWVGNCLAADFASTTGWANSDWNNLGGTLPGTGTSPQFSFPATVTYTTNWVTATVTNALSAQSIATNEYWAMYCWPITASGTEDDSALIQPILDRATNGPIVIHLAGTSQGKNLIVRSHTTLEAASQDAELKLPDYANDYLLTTALNGDVVLSSNIVIYNVTLDGNWANNLHVVITNTSPHFQLITNINGTLWADNTGYPEYNTAVWFNSYRNLTLDHVRFLNMPSFYLTLGGSAYDTLIEDCTLVCTNDQGSVLSGNTDGIHLLANISNLKIYRTTIVSNHDDLIALNLNEWTPLAMGWTNASFYPGRGTNATYISDVLIDGVIAIGNYHQGIRIYNRNAASYSTNLTIRNVAGLMKTNTTRSAINSQDSQALLNIRNWTFDNIFMGGSPAINLDSGVTGSGLKITNYRAEDYLPQGVEGVNDGEYGAGHGTSAYISTTYAVADVIIQNAIVHVPSTVTNCVIYRNRYQGTNVLIANSIFTGTSPYLRDIFYNEGGNAIRLKITGTIYPTTALCYTNSEGGTTTASGDSTSGF